MRLFVSIPLWIFCSLRLRRLRPIRPVYPSFNSVVDFLFPATTDAFDPADYDDLFQFRCGFSVPCDRTGPQTESAAVCFNSVVDFLFPATVGRIPAVFGQLVSIPLWIFCSLRPQRLRRQRSGSACFNSVVDFLFPATDEHLSNGGGGGGFNSVVDFLFPATRCLAGRP